MKTMTTFIVLGVVMMLSACNRQTNNPTSAPNPGPTASQEAEYYYYPDVEVYYHVPTSRYIYFDGGTWIYASTFPEIYVDFNWRSARVVVLDYHGSHPYHHHWKFKQKHPVKYKVKIKHHPGRGKGKRK